MIRLEIILVGIDFSAEADSARLHALHIARRQGRGAIILAHADSRYHGTPSEREKVAAMGEFVAIEALRCRDELCEFDDAAEVKVSHVCIPDHADPGLAKAANEYDVDLVVVGTHGRTGVGRFLLGSVAERTVRMAQSNVLVARGTPPTTDGYQRILVPTDFSDSAERALELAISLAPRGGHVHLLHCWQAPIPMGAAAGATELTSASQVRLRAELAEASLAQAHRLIARHRDNHVAISFDRVESRPEDAIVDELEAKDYDLCAMGSHGRRGWRRFLLGSTAERTVRHARCSVLVAQPVDDQP